MDIFDTARSLGIDTRLPRSVDEVPEGESCRRCGGHVGLGHKIIGLCSWCIGSEKKIDMKHPNYFRKVENGGRSDFIL